MNILIEPGTYDCLNMGDVAMLQVAVKRLAALWPGANIQVLTRDAAALEKHVPGVTPVPEMGRQTWLAEKNLLGRAHHFIPGAASRRITGLKRNLRKHYPALLKSIINVRFLRSPAERRELQAFLQAVHNADLFVVTGQGTITDRSDAHAIRLLDTLEMAIHRKIPTAMFGQGLGPVNDPRLKARARAVLPKVSFIAVREGTAGLPLLKSLAVQPGRVLVTGDDAIELAYELRAVEQGTGIGVNIRLTPATGLDVPTIGSISKVLHSFAARHGAPLLSVPIAFHEVARDPEMIRRVLAGSDEGLCEDEVPANPLAVIKQAGRCRVVVTIAYHAAVFALSQGRPVVCLAGTQYYLDKFIGLQEQFGAGCEIVHLGDPHLSEALMTAMGRAWDLAEQVEKPLLKQAQRQIDDGRAAYRTFARVAQSADAGANRLAAATISPS